MRHLCYQSISLCVTCSIDHRSHASIGCLQMVCCYPNHALSLSLSLHIHRQFLSIWSVNLYSFRWRCSHFNFNQHVFSFCRSFRCCFHGQHLHILIRSVDIGTIILFFLGSRCFFFLSFFSHLGSFFIVELQTISMTKMFCVPHLPFRIHFNGQPKKKERSINIQSVGEWHTIGRAPYGFFISNLYLLW